MPSYLVNALGNIIRIKDGVYIYADLGHDDHGIYTGFINLKTGDLFNNDAIHRDGTDVRFTLESLCDRFALSPAQIAKVSDSLQSLIGKGKIQKKPEQPFISAEDCWFDFLIDVDSISSDFYNWSFENNRQMCAFTTTNGSLINFIIRNSIHHRVSDIQEETGDGRLIAGMRFEILMSRIVELYGRRKGDARRHHN